MVAAPDDVLLHLYRAAREQPTAAFQDAALALVKPLLKFESAIWGSGHLTHPGISAQRMHLHLIDPEAAAAWKQINRQDKVIDIVASQPGRTIQFHAPTLFASREDTVMRDYAKRYGRQSYIITSFSHPSPPFFAWMSMYRPDPDDRFTEAQRTRCEALMAHFEQALLINEACSANRALAAEHDTSTSRALVHASGAICFAQATFLRLLAEEWPETDDHALPRPLCQALLANCGGGGRSWVDMSVASRGELVN